MRSPAQKKRAAKAGGSHMGTHDAYGAHESRTGGVED